MPQSLSKIYIHLVFSTKGRTDTIPKQHLTEVHAYVAEIFNNHHCPAIQVGGNIKPHPHPIPPGQDHGFGGDCAHREIEFVAMDQRDER